MKVQEIRERFARYFEGKSHAKLPSSSLIPVGDKTLLFANAGMNQFKDIFTGQATAQQKRAITVQKCVRAGGKHNDLENVGLTARHHTFFEMLGNFSFGDYFKKEAISYAWEFLTKELAIPEEKLFVTVHHSDDEALNIWAQEIGVPKEKIFKKGDKDNFWEMGEFGPCGPCSEIFYDHGEEHATPNFTPGEGQDLLDDELRYVEVWNLVFMQYEKTPQGTVELPNPSIDTGMGLERIAAVLQGKYWNYDTDAFTNIINKIEEFSGHKYNDPKYQSSMRIIADHVRSSVMLITDGITPSNEGRGYVLRRIIRRAVRHVKELNAAGDFLARLVPTVLEDFKKEYPENYKNISLAQKLLELEEKKFLETLETGMKYLDQAIKNDCHDNQLSGAAAFKLYDTYGFPLDLTEILLTEQGYKLDHQGFAEAMEQRKLDSKKSWKGGINEDKTAFYKSLEAHGTNSFIDNKATVTAKLLDIISLGERDALIFDRTPFYPEGGGQVGDTGLIDQKIEVLDTQKPVDGLIAHLVSQGHGLKVGNNYALSHHTDKRSLTARNHSATHLLQAALIDVLGNHVKQSGSMVNSERLRFDFTHMQGLTAEELKSVEILVNAKIQDSLNVQASIMSMDQARDKGAMALFGEKYGNEVRVLEMGDFSIELCGGTHVQNTSEIGLFVILSESSLSTGVRRIEATTSLTAFQYLKRRSTVLKSLELGLNTSEENIGDKVTSLMNEIKSLNKQLKEAKNQSLRNSEQDLFSNNKELSDGTTYCVANAPEGSDIRVLSDYFIDKNDKGVVLITAPSKGKISVLLRSSKNTSIPCNKILSEALKEINGRGGGKPNMAQGSGDPKLIDKLIATTEKLLQEHTS